MKNLNSKIRLFLADGNDKLYRYGFMNVSEAKAIKSLKKLYYKSFKNKYRKAMIFAYDKVVFKAIDGFDITGHKPKQYYGYEISKYKLKIMTEHNFLKPFYSNVLLEQKDLKTAYYDLINRYVKGRYRKDFVHALMFDISGTEEIEIARFKKDHKTGNIREFKTKHNGIAD